MGLFSSIGKIFGGGSSSSSTTSANNTVTVNPTTNVNFDLDSLVQALKDGQIDTNQFNSAVLQLQKEQSAIDIINTNIEGEKLTQIKSALGSAYSFIPLITIAIIYVTFFKNKKGE